MPSGSPSVFSTARKCGSKFAVGVFDREIFLMVAHHRDQDFFRQREKFGIEAAENRRRAFGQVDDRVEQRFVFAPARAGNGARGGIESFANLLFSRSRAEDFGRLAAPRHKPRRRGES